MSLKTDVEKQIGKTEDGNFDRLKNKQQNPIKVQLNLFVFMQHAAIRIRHNIVSKFFIMQNTHTD